MFIEKVLTAFVDQRFALWALDVILDRLDLGNELF